jgi:hypothetical protein
MMTQDELIRFLSVEEGYTPVQAGAAAGDLLVSQPVIQEAFESWRESGELPALAVEEFTLQNLVSEQGFRPVAALLTMDWLLTEPEVALAALREGYDRVETDATVGRSPEREDRSLPRA